MKQFFKLQYNKGHKSHLSLWNLHKDESWSKIKRPHHCACVSASKEDRIKKRALIELQYYLEGAFLDTLHILNKHGRKGRQFRFSNQANVRGLFLDCMKTERTLNLLKRRLKLLLSISEKGKEKTKLEAEAAPNIDSLVFFFFKVHLAFKARRFRASCSLRSFWRQCTWNLEDRCSPF